MFIRLPYLHLADPYPVGKGTIGRADIGAATTLDTGEPGPGLEDINLLHPPQITDPVRHEVNRTRLYTTRTPDARLVTSPLYLITDKDGDTRCTLDDRNIEVGLGLAHHRSPVNDRLLTPVGHPPAKLYKLLIARTDTNE